MDCPLISIIVPVYKADFWLPKCVKSILRQTYRNLEILLIDDGSPDKCPEICDRFAQKDKRVKVIHKENGGVSSARNKGIEESSGEYLFFVDSDDWLTKDAIETAYQGLIENDVQLSVLGIEYINLKNRTVDIGSAPLKIDFTDFKNGIRLLEKEKNLGSVWGKLFKTEIIKSNHLQFDQNIKFAEDSLFLMRYLNCCDAIYMTRKEGYCYNRLAEGTAITKYYGNILEWMLLLSSEREIFVQKHSCDQAVKDGYVTAKALRDFEFLLHYYFLHIKDIKEVIDLYKELYREFSVFFTNSDLSENSLEERIFKTLVHRYCIQGDFDGLYLHIKREREKTPIKSPSKTREIMKKIYKKHLVFAYRHF